MNSQEVEIQFGQAIALKHAEEAVARLALPLASESAIRLDFTNVEHVDPGVGTRIGNALRPHASRREVHATVSGIADERNFEGNWFRLFTRSAIGDALAQHATTIRSDGRDVTELVRSYYERRLKGTNYAAVRNLVSESSINVERIGPFQQSFRQLLIAVNFDTGSAESSELDAVSQLCFEACQNVRDHASKHPLPSEAAPHLWSFLSLEYHKTLSHAGAWAEDFRAYAERIGASRGGSKRLGFIRATVNDAGVGIAARQRLRAAIYEDDPQQERAAVSEALGASGSVKIVANDTTIRGDPGYGSVYIMSALRTLSAYATLRTGRVLAAFDGTSDQAAFRFAPGTLGYMPGTTLEIVFPRVFPQLSFEDVSSA